MGKDGSERKQLMRNGGTVMSEEASVNTGAVCWPGRDQAWWAIPPSEHGALRQAADLRRC